MKKSAAIGISWTVLILGIIVNLLFNRPAKNDQ